PGWQPRCRIPRLRPCLWMDAVHLGGGRIHIDSAKVRKGRGIKKPDLHLLHMRDDCQYLLETTAGLTYEEFIDNKDKMLAVGKLLEQIGENAHRLGRSFRRKHPEVRWDNFIESRHHLVHGYEHVLMDLVWSTVKEEIPALLAGLETLIREMGPAPQG
ncbi:MAG TPA: HepT-like ribonuclease domain-containing protein, partial [Spirochaetia bacterium]|nr:HepT-like ribonuclease domain-containing protein [Spirochaetia bacterium]